MTDFADGTDNAGEDWNSDILRAIVSHSSAEGAAMACAAAWLTHTAAGCAAVIVFRTDATCVIARAVRDDRNQVEVSVGDEEASVVSLLNKDATIALAAPMQRDSPGIVLQLPDRLAAVVVSGPAEDCAWEDEAATQLATRVTEQILSRTSERDCSFAEPRHMEAMAEFSAGAGHEINNPLGSIIGQAQLLLKKTDRADYREALETIGAQAWRIRDMIGDSMLFARPPQPVFRRCDVSKVVREACRNVQANRDLGEQQLRTDLPDSPLLCDVDSTQISTLLAHLLRNSVEATQDHDRRIVVTLRPYEAFAWRLSVDDNGPGIVDESVRRHLFDPFFSGRPAGRGLGFGLCLCWQIARQHGGLIVQQNVRTGGCRFVVGLPLSCTEADSNVNFPD